MKDKAIETLRARFADHGTDVDPGTWEAISGKLSVVNGEVLRDTLQEKFNGHEAHVDPQVWTNISSQLGHGAMAGAAGSAGWWAVGVAATLIAGGALFFSLDTTPETLSVVPTTAPVEAVTLPEETRNLAENPASGAAVEVAPTPASPEPAPVKGSTTTAASTTRGSEGPATKTEPSSTPGEAHESAAAKSPEGTQVVNAILQDIVDQYVTSPIVVVTEKHVPPPTPEEMPAPEVHPHHDAVTEEPSEPEPVSAGFEQVASPEILIPTAFSPNNDGANDEFKVSCKEYQRATVRIFSATTNALVFSADNLESTWNGRMMNSGQPCEPGMYFYAVEVTGADGRTWSKGEVVRLFR